MKDQVLEKRIKVIEEQEKQRRMLAARILGRTKKPRTRKQAIIQMIRHAKAVKRARVREMHRPMFGTSGRRGRSRTTEG